MTKETQSNPTGDGRDVLILATDLLIALREGQCLGMGEKARGAKVFEGLAKSLMDEAKAEAMGHFKISDKAPIIVNEASFEYVQGSTYAAVDTKAVARVFPQSLHPDLYKEQTRVPHIVVKVGSGASNGRP